MTDAERRLWSRLRQRQIAGARFRRQVPIGIYIVDFFCPEHRLIIELDGGQHAADGEKDERRTAWLNSRGYRVMRFWNHEIFEEFDPVLEAIGLALTTPHPNPPPQGGRASNTEAAG
jgi:very-short-patch-repair endonuclease